MRYEVRNELRLGTHRYAMGAQIDLEPAKAAPYLAVGALVPVVESAETDEEPAKVGKKAKA